MSERFRNNNSYISRTIEVVTGIGMAGMSTAVMVDSTDVNNGRFGASFAFGIAGLGLIVKGLVGPNTKPKGNDGNDNGGGGGQPPQPIHPLPSGGGITREVSDLTLEHLDSTPPVPEKQRVPELV